MDRLTPRIFGSGGSSMAKTHGQHDTGPGTTASLNSAHVRFPELGDRFNYLAPLAIECGAVYRHRMGDDLRRSGESAARTGARQPPRKLELAGYFRYRL